MDLPGAYSMSPFTSEESITSAYVKNERPDAIINIVDATNLSRSLFFTTQLMELGIPVVVALNKSDVNAKRETKIDAAALSAKLGCPVIATVSTSVSDKGLKEVVKAAVMFGVFDISQSSLGPWIADTLVGWIEGFQETAAGMVEGASPFLQALLIPLGIGTWQLAAAAVTGFIAKENVVGTLAVVYGITNFIDTEELALMGGASEVAAAMGLTSAAALACLMFNLFTPPCFAAIGAMNSEMQSGKWLAGGIALQLGTGYSIGFLVYQIGTLIATGSVGVGFIPGLIAVAAMAGLVVYLIHKTNKEIAVEYKLKKAA